ncbi:MAG: dihydroneopterin aldolase [Saprospiraceae bacterium]|nr:dihydroneopterin aldolase [Saprospiraceae bacterium]
MDKIALRGMQFRAFHGYYAEEHTVGNDYEVDVEVSGLLQQQDINDDLKRTFNYQDIYAVCQKEMENSQSLIETVAEQILDRLCKECPFPAELTVKVRKLRPMVGGPVQHAEIEMHGHAPAG